MLLWWCVQDNTKACYVTNSTWQVMHPIQQFISQNMHIFFFSFCCVYYITSFVNQRDVITHVLQGWLTAMMSVKSLPADIPGILYSNADQRAIGPPLLLWPYIWTLSDACTRMVTYFQYIQTYTFFWLPLTQKKDWKIKSEYYVCWWIGNSCRKCISRYGILFAACRNMLILLLFRPNI